MSRTFGTPFTNTLNLITGCCDGVCEHCVARESVKCQEGWIPTRKGKSFKIKAEEDKPTLVTLYEPQKRMTTDLDKIEYAPFPAGFAPTFHEYNLEEPAKWKDGRRVEVGMYGDPFNMNLPVKWITSLIETEREFSQHIYFNLTCNPTAIWKLHSKGYINSDKPLKNAWFGTTVYDVWTQMRIECLNQIPKHYVGGTFVVLDIAASLPSVAIKRLSTVDWVIIKSDLCRLKNEDYCRFWASPIVQICKDNKIPVFMYGDLKETMKSEFLQEFPKELVV